MEYFHTIDSNEQTLMSSSVVQPPWNLSTWIQLLGRLLRHQIDVRCESVFMFLEHFLPMCGDKEAQYLLE